MRSSCKALDMIQSVYLIANCVLYKVPIVFVIFYIDIFCFFTITCFKSYEAIKFIIVYWTRAVFFLTGRERV